MRDETGAGSPAEMGYSVTLASPTRLDGMIVYSSNGSRPSAWGTWGKLDEQVYHFDTFYADGLPAGQVICGFDFMRYQIPGVWTFQWSPPAKQ
ncbi:MAG: hypothetical protein AAGU05_12535 [Anaerolineaceae bacterium]